MNLVKNFNVCIINKNNNCIINKNNKVDAFIHSMVYSLSPGSFFSCVLIILYMRTSGGYYHLLFILAISSFYGQETAVVKI